MREQGAVITPPVLIPLRTSAVEVDIRKHAQRSRMYSVVMVQMAQQVVFTILHIYAAKIIEELRVRATAIVKPRRCAVKVLRVRYVTTLMHRAAVNIITLLQVSRKLTCVNLTKSAVRANVTTLTSVMIVLMPAVHVTKHQGHTVWVTK
jgi:hypothetical protein